MVASLEDYNNILQQDANEITSQSRQEISEIKRTFYWVDLVVLFIIIMIFVFISVLLIYSILPPLSRATEIIAKISRGQTVELDAKGIEGKDEIGELQRSVKRMLSNTNEIVTMAKRLASGNYESNLVPRSSDDELILSLIEMTKALQSFKNAAEDQYREVVEGTDNLVTQVDQYGNFTLINHIGESKLGVSKDDLARLPAFEFIFVDDREQTQNWFLECVQNKLLRSHIENRLVSRKTGEVTHWLWTSHFVYDEQGEFKGVNSIGHNITDRKKSEEKIRISLKEKETLLQEIHHRVKNNMQVIASLLKLQSDQIENTSAKQALKASQNRVYAMSAVHETLYASDTLSEIDARTYLEKISKGLFTAYQIDSSIIGLSIQSDDIKVNIEKANPLGLIVNELLSNSLKHGFPDGQDGEIHLRLSKTSERDLELVFEDNGIGVSSDFDWRDSKTLGLGLVITLVENQLDGSIEFINQDGLKFVVEFKV